MFASWFSFTGADWHEVEVEARRQCAYIDEKARLACEAENLLYNSVYKETTVAARAIPEMAPHASAELERRMLMCNEATVAADVGELCATSRSPAALYRAFGFFLALHRFVPEDVTLSPPHALDVVWHHTLHYTREYAALCARFAGRFVHHYPERALDEDRTARNKRFERAYAILERLVDDNESMESLFNPIWRKTKPYVRGEEC